jgi:hypothetical protein
MSQMKTDTEFPAIPSYTQSITQNQSWINITLTKVDSDGSKSQVLILAAKPQL